MGTLKVALALKAAQDRDTKISACKPEVGTGRHRLERKTGKVSCRSDISTAWLLIQSCLVQACLSAQGDTGEWPAMPALERPAPAAVPDIGAFEALEGSARRGLPPTQNRSLSPVLRGIYQ